MFAGLPVWLFGSHSKKKVAKTLLIKKCNKIQTVGNIEFFTLMTLSYVYGFFLTHCFA